MEFELIIRYIEGYASEDEVKKMNTWLKQDSKNEYYLKRVKDSLHSIKDYHEYQKLNINHDWEYILKRISRKPEDNWQRLLSIPSLKFYIRIAAVIVFAVITGSIFILFKEKPKQITQQIGNYEIYVPAGQKSELTLPDGSKVWVNADSKLKIPYQFVGDTREVWLEGEAFFTVAKNEMKPFFVHTSSINIKVLGTSFNVRAYSDEELIETTLIEGSVTLQKVPDNGSSNDEVVTLEPNYKAVYFKNKDAYVSENLIKEIKEPLKVRKILVSEPVNTELATSWKEGKLIFENEKLIEIIPKIERYYGVTFKISGKHLNEVRYTGTLKKISIEQTVKALQLATPFDYQINENTVLITTKNILPMESN